MEILEITDEVYNYYKDRVRGNENISRDQARRKLTRNFLLAMPVTARNEFEKISGTKKYIYGSLHIIVRNNVIIKIWNKSKGRYGGWYKDHDKYEELTKTLGIAN